MAGHAMGLAPGQHAVAVLVGNGVAVQLVAGPGIELEVARQRQGVGLGLLGGLAAVALLQCRQLHAVLQHQGGQAGQQASALDGRRLAPHGLVALARRRDCRGNVFGVAALDVFKWLAVRRVNHRDRAAGGGRDGGVGDVVVEHAGHCGDLRGRHQSHSHHRVALPQRWWSGCAIRCAVDLDRERAGGY